jgi:hypothetical protein
MPDPTSTDLFTPEQRARMAEEDRAADAYEDDFRASGEMPGHINLTVNIQGWPPGVGGTAPDECRTGRTRTMSWPASAPFELFKEALDAALEAACDAIKAEVNPRLQTPTT